MTANYSLSPKARWPAHVVDCKRALAWVHEHIAEYGGDPARVFVAGGSAGGHLAALLALTPSDPAWQPGFEQVDTSVVGCVALYGVYDLVDEARLGHPELSRMLMQWVFERGGDREAFHLASPAARVGKSAPPFLIVHGRNDVLVPVATAREFAAALGAVSDAPVAYCELPLAQHAFDVFWSPRTVHLAHAVDRFTAAVLAAGAGAAPLERS